jgi:transposase
MAKEDNKAPNETSMTTSQRQATTGVHQMGVATEGVEGERSLPDTSGGATPSLEGMRQRRQERPKPEVVAQARRRSFSPQYKRRFLEEADNCAVGDLGALLRREGLYDSIYRTWLKQRENGTLDRATPKPRGPAPRPVDPNAKRLAELERENRKLKAKLDKAEFIIEFQKKVASLLGIELKTFEEQKDQ